MTRPSVTVVITAYQVAPFLRRAVGSALAQDYEGPVDVVVVDDGSTDGTAAVLEGFGDAIRVVRRPNGGLGAAVDTGLRHAGGELIGLLDGDDTWPVDRLTRQVELLARRPDVGLVHGDMRIVDPDDRTIHESYFAAERKVVQRGDVFGELLRGNFVSGGASLFRASLLPLLLPIPTVVPWPDWLLALRAAEVSAIEHLEGNVNNYRLHGENMCLGVSGAALAGLRRRDVRFRRWLLAELWRSRASVADLAVCARVVEAYCHEAAMIEGSRPTAVAPVSAAEEAAGAVAFGRGLAAGDAGDHETAARLFACALGHDPWHGGARAELGWAIHLLGGAEAAAATGAPLAPPAGRLDARAFVVAADLDELLETPALLATFASAFGPEDDATLVVLAPGLDDATLSRRLLAALAAAGVPESRCPDVLALAGEVAAAARPDLLLCARAVLTAGEGTDLPRAPRVGPGEDAVLRARALLSPRPALEVAA